MTKPLIIVGDPTDHGGVVLAGSAVTLVDGKPVACVGDGVSCPQRGHGGTTVIATGSSGMVIDGRMVARHGDKTACGATLLSSQVEASNA